MQDVLISTSDQDENSYISYGFDNSELTYYASSNQENGYFSLTFNEEISLYSISVIGSSSNTSYSSMLASDKLDVEILFNGNQYIILKSINLNELISVPFDNVKSVKVKNLREGIQLMEIDIDIVDPDFEFEDCNDEIDNDNNGLVDCEESFCGPGYVAVFTNDFPSCNQGCTDGIIGVQATNGYGISLDQGESWLPFNRHEIMYFHALEAGTYTFWLKGPGDQCIEVRELELYAPVGTDSNCTNGSFELGSFDNWTGGVIDDRNEPLFNYNFDNTIIETGIENSRHAILAAPWTNSTFPEINSDLEKLGLYSARLNNEVNGNVTPNGDAARLTYCLSLADIPDNLIQFWYALAFEDPPTDSEHNIPELEPFFRIEVYRNNDPDIILYEEVIGSDDPLLVEINDGDDNTNNLFYKGWSCKSIDLGEFTEEEVCIEFSVTDCTPDGHFGYAYLDGLCSEDFRPCAEIIVPEVLCADSPNKRLIVKGGGYHTFSWVVQKKDQDNNVIETFQLIDVLGYDASLSLNDFPFFEPGFKYELELTLVNECEEVIVNDEFNFKDLLFKIGYCNTVDIPCGNKTNVKFFQDNTPNDNPQCIGCTYEWSNPGNLVDPTIAEPFVDVMENPMYLNETYSVTVTSPDGCIVVEDNLKFRELEEELILNELEIGYCDYRFSGAIMSKRFFKAQPTITATNIVNNEQVDIEIEKINNLEYRFVGMYDREFNSQIRINVTYEYNEGCITNTLPCDLQNVYDVVPLTVSSAYWRTGWPNLITKNIINTGELWHPLFQSLETELTVSEEGCVEPWLSPTGWNNQNSSVIRYELNIWDRWGNHWFNVVRNKPNGTPFGLMGDEFGFDFKNSQGNWLDTGTYLFEMTVETCYDGGSFTCPSCDNTFCGEVPAPFISNYFWQSCYNEGTGCSSTTNGDFENGNAIISGSIQFSN